MSHSVDVALTHADGSVTHSRVPIDADRLFLSRQQIAGVGDAVAQLTRVQWVNIPGNRLAAVPAGVFAMSGLTVLNASFNGLTALSPDVARLTALTLLQLHDNRLVCLPPQVGQLHALRKLTVWNNQLTALPAELGQLRQLRTLSVWLNRLTWLPLSLERLPAKTAIFAGSNPLALHVTLGTDCRDLLADIYAATTSLAMIREQSFTVCVGLQDLFLPALVTLEIVDAAFPNAIPMHKKWQLITAVKHHSRSSAAHEK